MENRNDFTETDVQNFETELSKIIQEVEANKKKQAILIQENNQLRAESIQLKANEARYTMTLEENFKLKKELETRSSVGLSEKDLAEVMLDAKRVANDIIQKSKDESLKIEQEKQKILTEIKLEGNILKDNILNFKFKINQDIEQWIQNLEQIIDGPKEDIS
ncbi:hypothetical protein EFE32_00450 [Lactococcus lactis subsp. lactis]|uniref:hypothetical protein n=1 Tax=Lactococcus lactis TaxID=1358 RepID=UPI00223AC92A|nr:hypothetical protein [Lactococcus lactis]MCT0015351.1 hypothetical protein [Lactococcus lactis subsp. lactis]